MIAYKQMQILGMSKSHGTFLVKKCNNLIALCPVTYIVACYYFGAMNMR